MIWRLYLMQIWLSPSLENRSHPVLLKLLSMEAVWSNKLTKQSSCWATFQGSLTTQRSPVYTELPWTDGIIAIFINVVTTKEKPLPSLRAARDTSVEDIPQYRGKVFSNGKETLKHSSFLLQAAWMFSGQETLITRFTIVHTPKVLAFRKL